MAIKTFQPTKKITVLIVDDHEVVRRGLTLILNQEPDFQVIGEARDGQEAVERVKESAPDIILMDWKMPRLDGLHAAIEIKRLSAESRILMLTGAPMEQSVVDILGQGIDGFVKKDISPEMLAQAIRVVHSGKPFFGSRYFRSID
jgi:DNA-binding NarL/FixJ family response regulator